MNIEIVLQILLILICLYLALFKSYFQEKGKNIATSEDIEELTIKVEAVKDKFIEKNSILKSKLDLLTNLQIGQKNDERLALIEFHKSISKWINLLSSSSINLINDYDNIEIDNKLFHYNEVYNEVLASKSLLSLYIEDKDLHDCILELKLKILESLSTNPLTTMINLKSNNYLIKDLDNETDHSQRLIKHKTLIDKRTEIHTNYRTVMLQEFKNILDSKNKYEARLRKLLKDIASEQ